MTLSTYTSKDLEAFDCISGLETITEQGRFLYQLTDEEVADMTAWFVWIGGRCRLEKGRWRYAIAEVLSDAWSEDRNGTATITIDTMEVSEALAADGVDRAPCLAEDTQLARLIGFIGPDEGES